MKLHCRERRAVVKVALPGAPAVKGALLLLVLLPIIAAPALGDGPYDLSWYTIDGGGATYSAGGGFTLGGTIGQPDAGAMSGGGYTLGGGFWLGAGSVSAVDDGQTVPDGGLPLVYRLYHSAPNPFNPRTQVAFDLPHAAQVRLRVYDVRGELVRTLVEAQMPAGHHVARWDGLDRNGTRAASGAYLFVIDAGDFHSQQKGMLLK